MNFSINNLGFKKYSKYSDKELAKAYVVYAIDCTRELNNQEWNILYHAVLKYTLRRNRLYISRIWKHGKSIYFIGKQSHGYGYSWDDEVINAFYPLLNCLAN